MAAFLNARAKAHNTKFLRIGDYTDIAQSGFGTRRHGLFAFDPYYLAGGDTKGGHFVMGSMEAWPVNVQWNTANDNNGTSSQQFPYLNSNLHKYELQTVLPSYPVEWQNVMLSNQVLLEKQLQRIGQADRLQRLGLGGLGQNLVTVRNGGLRPMRLGNARVLRWL